MNNKLKQVLLAMGKRDQAMRLKGKWTETVDKNNTLKLKQIIKKTVGQLSHSLGKKVHMLHGS